MAGDDLNVPFEPSPPTPILDQDLLLTAAMGATEYGLQGFDLPAAAAPLDWVNLMGYDIAGTWSPDTRFLAPLHRSPRAAIGGLRAG